MWQHSAYWSVLTDACVLYACPYHLTMWYDFFTMWYAWYVFLINLHLVSNTSSLNYVKPWIKKITKWFQEWCWTASQFASLARVVHSWGYHPTWFSITTSDLEYTMCMMDRDAHYPRAFQFITNSVEESIDSFQKHF